MSNQTDDPVDQTSPIGGAKNSAAGEYSVGYGKPPKHTQFKKGRRPNRKPAALRDRNLLDIFKLVITEKMHVREGDHVRLMKIGDAVIHKNFHSALRGNQNAMHNMSMLAEKAELFQDRSDPKQVGGLIAVPAERLTEEEWIEQTAGPKC